MSLLIKDLPKITIVSPFGERFRDGHNESHLGVDIRVVDAQYQVKKVLAPEAITIISVNKDPKWGHWITARPVKENGLGVEKLEFWHQVPAVNAGETAPAGGIISTPEAGYVSLHLHFVTWVKGVRVDPVPYIEALGGVIA